VRKTDRKTAQPLSWKYHRLLKTGAKIIGVTALLVLMLWVTRPDGLEVRRAPDDAPKGTRVAHNVAEQDVTANDAAPQPSYGATPGPATVPRADSSPQETESAVQRGTDSAKTATEYVAADEPDRRANDDAQDTIEGPLSISGRVLNLDGDAVPGVEIVARSYGNSEDSTDLSERQTRSDSSGFYEIIGLVAGDYNLRTVETARYPSAQKIVRAGLQSADIILTGTETVRLYGTVSDVSAKPLTNVEVIPVRQAGARTRTNHAGNYETRLQVAQTTGAYTVRFNLPGFVEERVLLQSADLVGTAERRVDARLQALDQASNVTGTLRSDRGDAVPGEIVQLHLPSLKTEYLARSGKDGAFSMPAVKTGSDYRLTIHPEGSYQNYSQAGILIGTGRQTLKVILRSLDTGRLTGRISDVEGYPIPGYSLLLKSNESHGGRLMVSADDGGYFAVENSPTGSLMFMSQSEPRFTVSGITLEAGTEENVEVVIDWGNYEMTGWVRDELSNPLAAAKIGLSWNDNSRGIQSSSLRQAVTDENGFFRFTQLGPGPHQLDVVALGYQRLQKVYNVDAYSEEIRVELRKVSQ
jgi:protocatechuate 3,4-dioxygenase beta subunit